MILQPATAAELSQLLTAAPPGKIERVDVTALNRVLQYMPEDMVVTAEAGITLAALQTELARHRQWLPLDPPHPERITLADIINANLSGPRRFGFGTIRDHLIGIKVVLADGTVINSGGKVVKNVAGYDLAKLFIGGHGTLGIILEATFKLRPLPEAEHFVEAQCATLEQADQLIESVIKSPITPVVLDLHNLAVAPATPPVPSPPLGEKDRMRGIPTIPARSQVQNPFTIVLGFAGTRAEVEWQLAHATELGFSQPSSLDYTANFWNDTNASPHVVPPSGGSASPDRLKAGQPTGNELTTHRLSVLPSKMVEALRSLNGAPFLARAGNGVIYHRGAPIPSRDQLPLELMRRLKDAYDPRHILPSLPL